MRKKHITFPQTHPVIAGIWMDNKGYVWVRVFSKDQKIPLDIYNPNGNFVEKRLVTGILDNISLESIFRNPLIYNDCIFAVVENAEGNILIKKYIFNYVCFLKIYLANSMPINQ